MRTFIAIEFDEAVRRQLGAIQTRLKPKCPKVKWVDPRQIHLTLKFLGEIAEGQVAAVGEALNALAGGCRPFEVKVEGLGCFPPGGGVDVLWVGLKDPSGQLAACQAKCEELIEPLGFPRERRAFSPHLTLARNRDPASGAKIRAALTAEPPAVVGTQTVTGVTFYHSTLTPQGPIYKPVSKHAFGG
jgi:2'-5' RNA ligase